MNKNIVILLICALFSNPVFGNSQPSCDWTQIKQLPDGGYEYDPQLHLCVGSLVQQNKDLTLQVGDLTKAVQLKDLALSTADSRTQLWQKSADDAQSSLSKIESTNSTRDWIFFGLGVCTTFLAGFMASKLIH
jgi:hypothetical protein